MGKLSHFWEGLYCSGHPGDTTSKTSPGFRFSAGSDSDSPHASGREVAPAVEPSAIFLTAILDNDRGTFGKSTEPTLGPAVGCITLIGGVFVVVLTSSCGESSNRLRDPAKSTHCQSQFAFSVASHIQEIHYKLHLTFRVQLQCSWASRWVHHLDGWDFACWSLRILVLEVIQQASFSFYAFSPHKCRRILA